MSKLALLVILFVAHLSAADANHGGCQHGGTCTHPIFSKNETPSLNQIPKGQFRDRLLSLSMKARQRALEAMVHSRIGAHDLSDLRAHDNGELYFSCVFTTPDAEPTTLITQESSTKENPYLSVFSNGFTPDGKISIDDPPLFESLPGSANVVYLDFNGDTLSTENLWNNTDEPLVAPPYDKDGDLDFHSESEQIQIYETWLRMAEDFAPYDINVTTNIYYDNPNNRGVTIGQVLFTPGITLGYNPDSGVRGVALLNVFGFPTYVPLLQPAWVFSDALSGSHQLAEVASHEFGHNLGLNHDGAGSQGYYSGHGRDNPETSWGPIMGANIFSQPALTQWSNGDYTNANNSEDDESIITANFPNKYRPDDHPNSFTNASPLTIDSSGSIDPTTSANQGIIVQGTNDRDMVKFTTGTGEVTISIKPFRMSTGSLGGNLDIAVKLYNEAREEIASSNPSKRTSVTLTQTLSAGTYYIRIRGVGTGDPLSSPPNGYVKTYSQGQYFISGSVVPATSSDLDDGRLIQFSLIQGSNGLENIGVIRENDDETRATDSNGETSPFSPLTISLDQIFSIENITDLSDG